MSDISEIFGRKPKRIVTGQHEDGTSYFVSVEEVDEDVRGIGSHRMWANDSLPVELPFLGSQAPVDNQAGTLGETLRGTNAKPTTTSSLRISLHKFPPTPPGEEHTPFLHWHDTFDVQWLVAGEMTIGLDDGSEVTMLPGDAVIQHGTNHSWRVGPEGAVLAIFMLGADRVGVAPPASNLHAV
ncbi:MAG TPA: hypothetical protein VNQ73_03865 [Ilumatobacter sp.]|nr:hypothetical protein [Ilumatobacter sp.]